MSALRCECGDTQCPSCGSAQGTYRQPLRSSIAKARQLFREHAGYSYTAPETPAQGRERCARRLASAEVWARTRGYIFTWEVDPDVTSADWISANEEGGRDCNPWCTWLCAMRDKAGKVVQSLGGVDFGRDGDPWGQPYARVVEAELALEQRAMGSLAGSAK